MFIQRTLLEYIHGVKSLSVEGYTPDYTTWKSSASDIKRNSTTWESSSIQLEQITRKYQWKIESVIEEDRVGCE